MSVKIRPLGKRILLRVAVPAQETVVGGIIVQAQANRDQRREAIVQALPDRYNGDLVVGDSVVVKPFAGVEMIVNGERLIFAKEAEVEAVLD